MSWMFRLRKFADLVAPILACSKIVYKSSTTTLLMSSQVLNQLAATKLCAAHLAVFYFYNP